MCYETCRGVRRKMGFPPLPLATAVGSRISRSSGTLHAVHLAAETFSLAPRNSRGELNFCNPSAAALSPY